MGERILLVEDEEKLARMVEMELKYEGYTVEKAFDGRQGLERALSGEFDLILLDIMLPQLSGMEVLRRLRKESRVPVIMLTARDSVMDKVSGLDSGADDYVTKPFNPIEVMARVKSQLRRYLQLGGGAVRSNVLHIGGIELDDDAKTVKLDGEAVNLTPKEYDILRFLMQNPGKVFSPSEIYRRVWDDLPLNADNALAVHIRHIREKIEYNPAEPRYLKVVWGKGYKMEADPR